MSVPVRLDLTSDAEQKAKLQRKLKEYDERLAFQAPEVDPHQTYKQRVLKELLEKGFVVVEELRERLDAHFGWAFARSFDDAVNIIASYNANDLSKIRGGTGLS